MKEALLFVGQIFLLTLLYQLSVVIVTFLHIPIPASVFGMIVLLVLLSKGLIHMHYVEKGAAFLNKHLAFFFIPIAVGLMAYGGLIKTDGLALIVMIAGSSIIGLFVTAALTDRLSKKVKGQRREHS
ncbi:murein hydrolase regulator LrgA [Domibacillus antri]|uniref:Murein hydrolase regulator LrgA n=1 Tax=Domibacillus antri TaxID=1714264 RepID=A0A1Q8Q5I9_9BACI|nr:CidA/LrgA family protein [Domibacillus antri]OLN22555.1 murein hydrolase regulator LrgA [Domibacillus antri]